ncbi:MAG TPA: c-type cytochrome [Candidatus Acidoferrales bacterium]|nr:c-type cytochrome [Candidatus Acidoferrales bacterium]
MKCGWCVAIGVAVASAAMFSGARARSTSGAAVEKAKVEHGRYLVVQVGLCGDCHTPVNEKGEPIEAQSLQGASVGFKPLAPVPNWAEYTPALAGFPGFTEEQAVTFLTTGKDPGGKLAAPPMPQFRFSKEDAEAIYAYLKSLGKK